MRKLTKKGSPWVGNGWIGVIASLLILSYYIVVIGWMLAYLLKMATGAFAGLSIDEVSNVYTSFISNPMQGVIFTLLIVIILGVIVTRGLKDGIENCCKYLMPALFVILIILAIRSIMLPGAIEGIKWYITPDFSKITPQVVLAALGQAFFAIGIGVAAAFVYGSYLDDKKSNIPGDATIIVLSNTMIAIVAGFIIFPAIFSFGMSPAAGPGLTFVTMPNLFSQMSGGVIFGTAFFFLVIIAGVTSGIGYLEAIVCTISEVFKLERKKAVWSTLLVIFTLSIPCILANGPWREITILGRNFFDLADFISGNVLMPLGALMISLYTAYKWKYEKYMDEVNVGAGKVRVYKFMKLIVIYLIPIAVLIIMVTGLI